MGVINSALKTEHLALNIFSKVYYQWDNSNMDRIAFKMKLFREKEEEYKKRHNEL